MNKPAISLTQVSFAYDGFSVLKETDFEVFPGELIGIMGPNGGGKTTLLKLLMGFLKPQEGSIEIFGRAPEKARLNIGYVPQVHRTDRDFPITVLELVLLGSLAKTSFFGTYPAPVKQKAFDLIERLGLTEHKNKPFGSLSGGLAQRALLARALLSDPDVLLLDEPTANIDPPSSLLIFDLLEEMKGKKTILIVTHDLRTIVERVTRILCVQGQVTSFLPSHICEHFALGLYHTPLLDLPKNHLKKSPDDLLCVH
jgi:zinc transport system ATP-binding protein